MQRGFSITIKGFLAVEDNDLDAMEKAIAAIRAAQAGKDYGALLGLMKVEEFTFKQVNRRGKDEPA